MQLYQPGFFISLHNSFIYIWNCTIVFLKTMDSSFRSIRIKIIN